MKSLKYIGLVTYILVVYSSCSISKKNRNHVVEAVVNKDMKVVENPVVVEQKQEFDYSKINFENNFSTIQFKGKCSYTANKKSQNFSANFKIKKDSVIQISIIGMGIAEVYRILVTKDSVFALDKMNNVAYIKSYNYLSSLTGVDISYDYFQSILLNELPTRKWKEVNLINNRYIIEEELNHKLKMNSVVDPDSKNWLSMVLSSLDMTKKLNIDFINYSKQENYSIALKRNLVLLDKNGNQNFEMELEKIRFNEVINFQMAIPEKFKIER